MTQLDRPKEPYPDFPLTPHASGAWQKKIRGRIYYFGKWARRVDGKLERIPGDGWKEAPDEYKAVADDLHAGRTPRVKGDGLTVADGGIGLLAGGGAAGAALEGLEGWLDAAGGRRAAPPARAPVVLLWIGPRRVWCSPARWAKGVGGPIAVSRGREVGRGECRRLRYRVK